MHVLLLYQHEVFQGFAKGTYNLLIATKSAEDLDVPKASIVIRFVLFA
jgi:endoribonuclease Dicer